MFLAFLCFVMFFGVYLSCGFGMELEFVCVEREELSVSLVIVLFALCLCTIEL